MAPCEMQSVDSCLMETASDPRTYMIALVHLIERRQNILESTTLVAQTFWSAMLNYLRLSLLILDNVTEYMYRH
uniref:Uncharacterized protein n=1 Tax=Oryza sativa subsp. japonica TaxID=39947 RepID=Q8L4G9_ORYSJ|nr:hypothetical protein [Oryza sativa Japonica Group]BAD30672.1 hypothetical protein [Oryza sativa Japonica Group]